MASELRVNTLKDAAGNNSIATSVVARGSAKATLFYNQVSPTVLDSYNVASVTDVSTGVFDPQYTNNMGSGNYSCSRMGVAVAANLDVVSYAYNKAAGSVRCYNGENNAAIDYTQTDVVVFGDLA